MDTSLYPIEDIMRAISILLMIVKDYMLVPGKIENWFIIVEAKNTTAFSVPFTVLHNCYIAFKLNIWNVKNKFSMLFRENVYIVTINININNMVNSWIIYSI